MQPEAPTDPRQSEPRPSEALDAADADLRAVEATLGRIDAGAYGRCAVCNGRSRPRRWRPTRCTRTCALHEAGPADVTG